VTALAHGLGAARRPLPRSSALALAVVTILLVAGIGYVGARGATSSSVLRRSCAPPSSLSCTAVEGVHDLSVIVPLTATTVGASVPFTAVMPAGEAATRFSFNFGDGNTTSSSSPSVAHAFDAPGTYLISVEADVDGIEHDNDPRLAEVTVPPSIGFDAAGIVPSFEASIAGNSSAPASTGGFTAVLHPGASVSVAAEYTAPPFNASYVSTSPGLAAGPGLGLRNLTTTAQTAAGTAVANGSASVSWVRFADSAVAPNGTTISLDYIWTVFVASAGVPAGVAQPRAIDPHPGSLEAYELDPGGASSVDPDVDTSNPGYEVLANVYEPLVSYNATSIGPTWEDYDPTLATCVPGSPLCEALYGSSLVSSNEENYTFVLDGSARFYDPATRASWGVYPSDVLFSVARDLAFADLPCWSCNAGWILGQALLGPGNVSWDANHWPANNTPSEVFAAVTVNDSSCPAIALTQEHGCVTFHAFADGVIWPYLLELVADLDGGAIVPCGWFSAAAQGAGIPYWTQGNVSGAGDRPCSLPGGATSSSDPAFQSAVQRIPATGWDAWEADGSEPPYLGDIANAALGSGPYELRSSDLSDGYTLGPNVAYSPPQYCHWAGCFPAAHAFAPNVSVVYEDTAVPGEQAYASGTADVASIPPTDTALLLQLVEEGKIGATSYPLLYLQFMPFALDYDPTNAREYTTAPINIPPDFFGHVGLRQFLVHAYPYATDDATISTLDGVQYYHHYGGIIPEFMGPYYPTNVSFPAGNPDPDPSDVGGAAWWWHQANDPTSPWYDPELANCTASSPCEFSFMTIAGAPDNDVRATLFSNEIASLTGGAIRMDLYDLDFASALAVASSEGPGQSPFPFYALDWGVDYADPTDFVTPMYEPNGIYTSIDAVSEALAAPAVNQSTCHPWTDYAWFAAQGASTLSWTSEACQGAAYASMTLALEVAAHTVAGPTRTLLYNLAEQIANQLALYVYEGQATAVATCAAWIDPSTINANALYDANVWFGLEGNDLA
jgi:PKD domain-containing protein